MRPWVHKAAMSATVTAIVLGAMAAEGLVLTSPGHSPPPPAAAGQAARPAAGHPRHAARPGARVSLSPQPGDGAHLAAEQSPSPRPARSSPAARPGPAASPPAPRPSPSPDPVPQPSTTTPAPKASPLCAVNLLGIRVCLPGQGQ